MPWNRGWVITVRFQAPRCQVPCRSQQWSLNHLPVICCLKLHSTPSDVNNPLFSVSSPLEKRDRHTPHGFRAYFSYAMTDPHWWGGPPNRWTHFPSPSHCPILGNTSHAYPLPDISAKLCLKICKPELSGSSPPYDLTRCILFFIYRNRIRSNNLACMYMHPCGALTGLIVVSLQWLLRHVFRPCGLNLDLTYVRPLEIFVFYAPWFA